MIKLAARQGCYIVSTNQAFVLVADNINNKEALVAWYVTYIISLVVN